MSNKRDLSLNELIKVLGKKSDTKIRQSNQALLKDKKTTKLFKTIIPHHLNTINGLKENTEVLSQQMNFPTKNDIANVAKLVTQIEEKVDSLEESILQLLQTHHPSSESKKSNKSKKSKESKKKSKESDFRQTAVLPISSSLEESNEQHQKESAKRKKINSILNMTQFPSTIFETSEPARERTNDRD